MNLKEYTLSYIEHSWQHALAKDLHDPYFDQLIHFVERERAAGIPVYPPREQVFNALAKTPFDKVRVVIVGQDPYHGPGQAHGLCFSVSHGVRPPPSLINIFKELKEDVGMPTPSHGCLEAWANQGILLLNATLTVRQGTPMSHYGQGWERFTDSIIAELCLRKDPVIFVLWGRSAQDKCRHALKPIYSKRHPSWFLIILLHYL